MQQKLRFKFGVQVVAVAAVILPMMIAAAAAVAGEDIQLLQV